MAILNLHCTHCHNSFMIDDETISWKTTDNWFEPIDYQETICPKCGYYLHFNHIKKIRDDLD